MNLRPYQQAAVDAATAWMRKSINPALLELATGAGKSFICAAVADWIYEHSGKKVLCLQPSKELTEQNFKKFLLTGKRASIFSAAAGQKDTRHNVIYGTPGSVKNSIERFSESFGAVILDEAHGITPTIQAIIDHIRSKNQAIRVLGMTATPYRMQSGYIYQYDTDGRFEEEASSPYFSNLIYSIQTRELIDMGYLTQAHADPSLAAEYAAGNMQLNSRGQFSARDVERAFEGRGRLTSSIVADVVEHARYRQGVMLFAATVDHAKEILESLPPGNAMMLGGDVNMGKKDRENLVNKFKAKKYKYIVSVGTLTTGFDAPHVDLVAVLRATESPGLFQQIIGRGLRLHPGKSDCLVLDYAQNIERHGLQDDLFAPKIRAGKVRKESGGITAKCPMCGYDNEFSARENPDGLEYSDDGYFLDLAGNPVETEYGPMPSHHGRRCRGQVLVPGVGRYDQCAYRWTAKSCPECQHDNDITARRCESCRAELVNPNEKLRIEFARIKADPYTISTDKILSWDARKKLSKSGREVLVCDYVTECRSFRVWYTPDGHRHAKDAWESLSKAVFNGRVAPDIDTFLQYLDKGNTPKTITCSRERGTIFYRVIAHNRPADIDPGDLQ